PLDTRRSKADCGFTNNLVAIQRRSRDYGCLVSRRLREVEGSRIQRSYHGRVESRRRRAREAALGDSCDNRLTVAPLDIVVENLEEIGDNSVALQRHEQLTVHVDRRFWLFESSGERDSNICMLGFAWPIDHATHHRDSQVRYGWIA